MATRAPARCMAPNPPHLLAARAGLLGDEGGLLGLRRERGQTRVSVLGAGGARKGTGEPPAADVEGAGNPGRAIESREALTALLAALAEERAPRIVIVGGGESARRIWEGVTGPLRQAVEQACERNSLLARAGWVR